MFECYPESAAFIYLYNLQLEIFNFLYKDLRIAGCCIQFIRQSVSPNTGNCSSTYKTTDVHLTRVFMEISTACISN